MEVTQLLSIGLGLAVGLNPQYSHPVCMTTKLECCATINDSWEFVGIPSTGISLTWGKQCMQNFLMGAGEVQTFQMKQLHNDHITNVNGQKTDRWNK